MTKQSHNKSPASIARMLHAFKAGILVVFQPSKVLDLAGQPTDQPDAVKEIDTALVSFDRVADLRKQLAQAILDREAALAGAESLLAALEAAVVAAVGARSPKLVEFGLKPRAEPQRTAAEKAEAAKKAVATRKEHEAALQAKPQSPPPSSTK